MTLEVASRNDYIGTGLVDTYAYGFKIFAAADLQVTIRNTDDVETELAYPADFDVTGVASDIGGTIVLTAGALDDDFALTIRRLVDLDQQTDLRNQQGLFPEVLEDTFDKLTMIDQQQQDLIDACIRLPVTTNLLSISSEFPFPAAGQFIRWNLLGTELENVPVSGTEDSFIQSGTGAVPRSWPSKAGERVTFEDFGAVAGGVVDCTVAVRRAFATGRDIYSNGGVYKLTDSVPCATAGQRCMGEGRTRTVFLIDSDFNLAAGGVFIASTGEPGPTFQDIGIKFVQPDTAVRANLIAYPPAFKFQNTPRFRLINVRISRAKTAIDMTGNSGGAAMNNVEISSFDQAILIDGSLDTVRLSQIHVWTFDLLANHHTIFNDTSCHGIKSGRCDDLKITDAMIDCGGKQMEFYQSASGSTFGAAFNVDFDGYSEFVMSAGDFTLICPRFTNASVGKQGIRQTGGRLQVVAPTCSSSVATTNPFFSLSGAGALTTGYMNVVGGNFNGTGDMTFIECKASSGSNTLQLNGATFIMTQNLTNAKPVVSVPAGGRIMCSDNYVSDKGTGTGKFLDIVADDQHFIGLNVLNGWTVSLPASPSTLVNPSGPSIAYNPVISATTGAFTTVTATGKYLLTGGWCEFEYKIVITTNGTAAGAVIAVLPVVPAGDSPASGINSTDSIGLTGNIPSADARVLIYKASDGSYPGANNKTLLVKGRYRI